MLRVTRLMPTALILLSCLPVAGRAASDPVETAAIGAALQSWRDDFNAGRGERICDLFAPDLLYDFQGLPEQDFTRLCHRLHTALANPARRFHYDLTIKEIIVSGDLAVVRLVWASTVTDTASGKATTGDEPGLDVFRREPDGAWKIIRYLAYPATP